MGSNAGSLVENCVGSGVEVMVVKDAWWRRDPVFIEEQKDESFQAWVSPTESAIEAPTVSQLDGKELTTVTYSQTPLTLPRYDITQRFHDMAQRPPTNTKQES